MNATVRQVGTTIGKLRWVIAGLLFMDTILNYVDLQTLSVLAAKIEVDLKMSDKAYLDIIQSFQIAYLIMFFVGGFIIDRIGVRIGMALAIGWWSITEILHGYAHSAHDLMILRFLFGLAYPGAYLCAAKVVSEWFPSRERGTVTGIYTAGATIGGTIAPPLIAWMYSIKNDWRPPFIVVGSLGLVYVVIWLIIYRAPEKNKYLSAAERNYILDGREEAIEKPQDKISFWDVFRNRYFWIVALGRMIGDNPWTFYITSVPLFLDHKYGMTVEQYGAIGWIPFVFSDVGSLGGGWISGWLAAKFGWPVLRGRLTVMFAAACITMGTFLMGLTNSTGVIIGLLCLMMLSTMAWMTNLSTVPNDTFPERLIGRVVGMTTMCAIAGSWLFTRYIISPLFDSKQYGLLFIIMSFTAPVAFIVIQLLLLGRKKDSFVPNSNSVSTMESPLSTNS